MSLKDAEWAYSTDTLQADGNPGSNWQETASLDPDADSLFSDDADTRTITNIPITSGVNVRSQTPQATITSRLGPPTGFDRSGSSLGSGLGTFLGPSAADTKNPNLFILTFEREDLLNNTLCTPEGEDVYTISTKAIPNGLNPKGPVDGMITKLYKVGSVDPVATFSRSKTGAETLTFGLGNPIKRSDWLKTNRPFQKGVGSFNHDGVTYRWIKQHEKYKNTTLELHSSDSVRVATYKDSRRDWSVPPPALVIHKARIEIISTSVQMLDEIVLSLILTEVIRVKAKPSMDPRALAATAFMPVGGL